MCLLIFVLVVSLLDMFWQSCVTPSHVVGMQAQPCRGTPSATCGMQAQPCSVTLSLVVVHPYLWGAGAAVLCYALSCCGTPLPVGCRRSRVVVRPHLWDAGAAVLWHTLTCEMQAQHVSWLDMLWLRWVFWLNCVLAQLCFLFWLCLG